MSLRTYNSKFPICGFCKHWYDPSNSALQPKSPAIGLWDVETTKKNKCLKNNMIKNSTDATCNKFENKLN